MKSLAISPSGGLKPEEEYVATILHFTDWGHLTCMLCQLVYLVCVIEWRNNVGGCLEGFHGTVVVVHLYNVSITVCAQDGPQG